VITCMVICAAGAVANAATPMILLGALMFYVSDLAVARDRFVATGFGNRVWGLPLYYGGQLVLASSIAG
ncbi:MAG: lysoplasmalogenase family protein, partial [Arenicellales bacterium]|nr:lysoplasmalogenase family protein [Arenicellales bacterium]